MDKRRCSVGLLALTGILLGAGGCSAPSRIASAALHPLETVSSLAPSAAMDAGKAAALGGAPAVYLSAGDRVGSALFNTRRGMLARGYSPVEIDRAFASVVTGN